MTNKYLIVVTGPTGIGKTDLAIHLAKEFSSVIISGDSRQIYREMHIGTAVPSNEQQAAVPHYLIKTHSIDEYYNAYQFEQDVLNLTNDLFHNNNPIVLAGGSMMYIDALCNGIDDIPTIDSQIREDVLKKYNEDGIESIRLLLKKLDPLFYSQIDLKNPKRVIHAVEVCLMAGRPYSDLRTNKKIERPFKIIKIGLTMDRDELYNRINTRVDNMISDGLIDEARTLYPKKHLNSLNTVGYKELFDFFEDKCTLEEAIELIKRNSRRYAKRQLTWFKRDTEMTWFKAGDIENVINFVKHKIENTERPATN